MKNIMILVLFVFAEICNTQTLPTQVGWEGSSEMPHGLRVGIPLTNNWGLFVSPKTLFFSNKEQWSISGGLVINTTSFFPFESNLSLGMNYSVHEYSWTKNKEWGVTAMLAVTLLKELYVSLGYCGPGTGEFSPHGFDSFSAGIGFNLN